MPLVGGDEGVWGSPVGGIPKLPGGTVPEVRHGMGAIQGDGDAVC